MKQTRRPQFLIAAPSSGSGKTSIGMALMALLTRKGYNVQPFKCGPDYIDTRFHQIATGNPSINLDTFMASENHVSQLYARYSNRADISIVEGMMGLFDGYRKSQGSSAEIARILGIPVILVVDAKSTSYSVAPLIHGFSHFDPDLSIAGVIFNRVGSERHEAMLKDACVDAGVNYLGSIRRNEDLKVASRYLGLDISPKENKKIIEGWADFIEEQIDVDALLEKMMHPVAPYTPPATPPTPATPKTSGNLRIAVARSNESFAFMYEETLDKLRELGKVIFFNPETKRRLPPNIDLLYFPGGYPEKRLRELTVEYKYSKMLRYHLQRDIVEYIMNGGRTLAECGGMIYLSEGVYTDEEDDSFVGLVEVLPFRITADENKRRLTLGYRQFDYNGQHIRGHEFHYTQICEDEALMPSAAQVYNAVGQPVSTPVFRYKNLIASYTHLYLGEADILQLWNDDNINPDSES